MPGGYYTPLGAAAGGHTRLVPVECYALQGDVRDAGSILALWACVAVRYGTVLAAETLMGDYAVSDILDLGESGRYPVSYESPLRLLKWWRAREAAFVELEAALKSGPVSWFMNILHGNALVSSLGWLVASANCRPAGLGYELPDIKMPESGAASDGGRTLDLKGMEAVSYLKKGRLKIATILDALMPGAETAPIKPEAIAGNDGFLNFHRELLQSFRGFLAKYVAVVPEVGSRFVNVPDMQLGIALADLHGALMRASFPDAFTAMRDLEELQAQKIRDEKAAQKKGVAPKPGAAPFAGAGVPPGIPGGAKLAAANAASASGS
ncbi:hypothetical protein OH491_23695 [Termitidicoccus mucosus]|uniref:hypothetical protein n=1 Tax=Termitidicoccus mucosus TaxID=1184151 RepID=UPI0011AB575C